MTGVPPITTSAAPGAAARLRAAATFGAVGLAVSGVHALTGLGIPCPWRALTHTLCPFCGATTMGSHLLQGDVAAAWASNQFVFVLLVVLAIACVVWTVELLGGRPLRLPAVLRDQRVWYVVGGVAALAFAIVRNLVPLG